MSTTGRPDEVMESGICWKTRSSVVSPAAVQSFVLTASPRRRRSSSVSLTAQRPRTAVSSDPRTAVRVSLKARAKKFPTRAAMPFQNRSLMRSQNPPPGGMHRCQPAGASLVPQEVLVPCRPFFSSRFFRQPNMQVVLPSGVLARAALVMALAKTASAFSALPPTSPLRPKLASSVLRPRAAVSMVRPDVSWDRNRHCRIRAPPPCPPQTHIMYSVCVVMLIFPSTRAIACMLQTAASAFALCLCWPARVVLVSVGVLNASGHVATNRALTELRCH